MAGLMEGQGSEIWLGQGYEDSRFELRDPISPSFHCPICMNVLNDPVMCRNNQHYFCRACITKHLTNTHNCEHNCPTCQDELTVDTLVQASRIMLEYLSELRIRCDFFNRGCRDVTKLSDLERHVSMCGFAAVKCSNEGCEVVINRQDKLHHEAEVCEFRRLQCHDCVELKKEVRNITQKMTEDNAKLKKQVDDLSKELTEDNIKLQKQVENLSNGAINSVEIFSWTQKTWTLLNPMSRCRSQTSAVVYKGNVHITGGKNENGQSTDTMETSYRGGPLRWKMSPVKLPELCRAHAAVMYKDSLLLSGGQVGKNFKASDKIYEISMVPPYSTKILTTMPEPRYDHTMVLFEDKLFIFGGYDGNNTHDTVMMYNLVTKEWKMMTPLPLSVDEMATVLWQNNVIVLGGRNCKDDDDDSDNAIDTVVMYNLTTGESKYLPSMKHKRRGCAAVVTSDILVVMGGRVGRRNYFKSVEAFHFQEQVWEELPDMNETRAFASAVMKLN